MDTLTKHSAVPLYYQLEMRLRTRLGQGEFAPGDHFPGETTIASEYGVSRMTVRQALSALERDSLIRRARGRATCVTERVRQLWAPKLSGSLDDAMTFGLTDRYRVRLLGREDVTPSAPVLAALSLPTDTERVHRIRRIRLHEGSPLAYIVNHMPIDIGRQIGSEDILARLVLVNLEEKAGLRLVEAQQRIGAVAADPEIADLLGVSSGDPLLHMERTVIDHTGRAVNFSAVFFRADRYWYTARLERTGTCGQRKEINWRYK
ncbi:MAG: GntR family transcriptional regulator [Deltaproteobacteria bacterium]|nr:GntR family transcriptional regulator [Deltaproteobacteria bacterium]